VFDLRHISCAGRVSSTCELFLRNSIAPRRSSAFDLPVFLLMMHMSSQVECTRPANIFIPYIKLSSTVLHLCHLFLAHQLCSTRHCFFLHSLSLHVLHTLPAKSLMYKHSNHFTNFFHKLSSSTCEHFLSFGLAFVTPTPNPPTLKTDRII
jgi:hypothetical protein